MTGRTGGLILLSRLNLRQFTILSAVAETGSILQAARRLNMTQPAVSRAVAELERIVDRPLFERTRRGTRPTPAGEVLIGHARAALSEMRAAWEGMEDVDKGVSGRISLGLLPNGVAGPLPAALAAMRHERPGVAITVVEGLFAPLMSSLRAGVFDMVIGRLDHPDPAATAGLVSRALYRQEWVVLARAGHPYLARQGLSLADLVGQAWIVPVADSPIRRVTEEFFQRKGLPLPPDRLEISGLGVSRAMLLECDLLICLPRGTYRTDTDMGHLAEVDVTLEGVNELVGLFRLAEARSTPAEALFLQILARICRAMRLPDADMFNPHI
jgi:molybdate transport repressor ModE-like protein